MVRGGDQRVVIRVVEPAGGMIGAGLADLRRLREGADGGGREGRQAEPVVLRLRPDRIGGLPPGHGGGDGGKTRRHGRVVDARRCPAGRQGGIGRGQICFDRAPALAQGLGKDHEFVELLHREGEPRAQLRIEPGLAIEIDRYMQQSAGRGKLDPFGPPGIDDRGQPVEQCRKIRPPDIAAVDHPQ